VLAVPETREGEHVGLDPVGTILSALAIGGLVLGIIDGPSRGWTDPVTLAGIIGGVVVGLGFVRWELRTATPLLDPRLFRIRGFATGSASLFLQFFAMFGFFFISLQYLQLVLGYGTPRRSRSDTASGSSAPVVSRSAPSDSCSSRRSTRARATGSS
jgi:hypothetical protein